MKKPKIKIVVEPHTHVYWDGSVDGYAATIMLANLQRVLVYEYHPTKKAAREWAKDWCRTVGAALMEKGGLHRFADVCGVYYAKPVKEKGGHVERSGPIDWQEKGK